MFDTDKKYKIIYADPPWAFKVWSNKGKEKSPEQHYNVMSRNDILDMPVADLADNTGSVLFLWVTFPMLELGIKTMETWGFTYKTCAFTWVKLNKKQPTPFVGLGYYTRANAEICLLGTRGKVLPRQSKSVQQVILSPIREHSRKPEEARDRIVELFGDVPRIELFAREKTPGWDVWGDEVDKL
jgi:N6-adenosine-specific RNA methylase IME4